MAQERERRKSIGASAVGDEAAQDQKQPSIVRQMTRRVFAKSGAKQSTDASEARGLPPLRVLKMATLGLPKQARCAGRWRYEVTLETVSPEDEGSVMVGWSADIKGGGSTWEASLANGEVPTFDTPTRWWGAVFRRAELAAVAGSGTVIISLAVELNDESDTEALCWFNLYRCTSKGAVSVYEGSEFKSAANGWQRLPLTGYKGGEVYPVLALCSSSTINLNFGQFIYASANCR